MNTLSRSLLVGAALAGLLSSPALADPTLERIRSSGRVVLGYRDNAVPFSYLDEHKKPIGYSMDICLRLVEALRAKTGLKALKVDYLPVTAANRVQLLQQGQVDLECGATTNNAERRGQVAFTIPHFITGTRILVKAGSKVERIEDMEGRKLVSTVGSTSLAATAKANKERMLRIQMLEAPDHAAALDMVDAGRADGFAMDEVLLLGLIAGRPDPSQYKVVGKYLSAEPLAIMLNKDATDLKKLVDEQMRELIYSRALPALYDKWFTQPIPPRKQALHLPLGYLLRDFWKYPTDFVPF